MRELVVRHAAPVSYARSTITRKLPLIKIASTEAVMARERVSPVFVRYPAERLLNERLMLGPRSVSTTNFDDIAPGALPTSHQIVTFVPFKNIAGKPVTCEIYIRIIDEPRRTCFKIDRNKSFDFES